MERTGWPEQKVREEMCKGSASPVSARSRTSPIWSPSSCRRAPPGCTARPSISTAARYRHCDASFRGARSANPESITTAARLRAGERVTVAAVITVCGFLADARPRNDEVMNILLTPARIGPVEIKNRIVMPPMTTRTADAEGFVTDDTVAYYMARVRGGVGLITVEMASPEKCGRHRRHEVGIYDDRFIPGLTRLVDEIHRGGAKASIQLGHGGGHTRIDICGETPIAPSAIPHPVYETTFETIVPEAMTKARIAQTIAAHAAAARRAQAGRLRLRRDPRRARLSDLAIPCAVREPAQRRIWRQPGEPRPLRAGSSARGEGGGAGPRRRSIGSRSRISFPAACRSTKAGRSRSGRRRPAPTRCTSPPDIIARCRRRRSCCRR